MSLASITNIEDVADEKDILSFTVVNRQINIGGYMGKEPGDVTPLFSFKEETI